MTGNILTLLCAVLFLARYYNSSCPESGGFLKSLPKLLFWTDTSTEDEADCQELDETILQNSTNCKMFDNFAKLIQKEVEECDKTELEGLLQKWNKEILDLAKRKLRKKESELEESAC